MLGLVKLARPPPAVKHKRANRNSFIADTPRDALRDMIFRDVMNLSQDRIMQRIRPPWVASPAYYHEPEQPLWKRLGKLTTLVRSRPNQIMYASKRTSLDQLISNLRILDCKPETYRLQDAVEMVVRCCAELSYDGGHKSLESQLRHDPVGQSLAGTREVMQIDKLARYLGLCKDLAKLSQMRPFRNTIKTVTLEPLTAFEEERPVGALRPCFVHAEVQLILHYEQHPPKRPP